MQDQTRDLVQGHPILAAVEGFFRQKRLFTTLFAVVLVGVAAVTLIATRQYRSETKFLLENNRSNAVIAADRSAAPAVSEITEQQINSELEVLASEDVLNRVADPGWISLGSAERTPAVIKRHQDKLDKFRKRLTIEPVRKSNVITVSYRATSPQEATETLERFSAVYLAHRKQLSRPKGTAEFFADQARRYQQTWRQANAELVAFQQQYQLVSVQDTEQTLSREIAHEEEALSSSQASLAEMQQRVIAGRREAAEVPERQQTQQHTILSETSVDQMRTLLLQLQNRRTELLTRFTAKDPLVIEVNHQIADTQSSLNAALAHRGLEDTTDVNPAWQRVKNAVVEGSINRQALRGRDGSLRRSIAGLQARLGTLQSLDVRFNALQEQVDQSRSNFELFAEKRDQAQIEDAMDERKLINIAVAETPTTAFRPVSPKPLLNAVLGLLTALFLATGAGYCAESLRNTVASARELELVSRYPVLATVSYAMQEVAAPDPDGSGARVESLERESMAAQLILPAMQNFGKVKEA